MSNAAAVLSCQALCKHFQQGDTRVDVLKGVDLAIQRGERVAIVGASGSGKTTLLQLLGGLDLPSSGSVHINGQSVSELSDAARGDLRNRALGFVYQFHHLLPEFTALENVAMPLLIRRTHIEQARAQARSLLERVGLAARIEHHRQSRRQQRTPGVRADAGAESRAGHGAGHRYTRT
jgi:lipoprotein-releasing system ATP-binding protein